MHIIDIKSINMERLEQCINELRDVLNEICSTLEETVENNERLIVSRLLDELIVEYMNRIKNI